MTGRVLSERQPTSMAVLYDGREAVHFTAHEGNFLVVLSVPSSNAKYPTSQVLRRQHALNFAQKVDDAIVRFSDAGEANSDEWGVHAAGVDFAIEIHETAVVEISFSHADEQAIASAFLPLRQAVIGLRIAVQ